MPETSDSPESASQPPLPRRWFRKSVRFVWSIAPWVGLLIVALLAVSVMSSPDDRPPSHVAIAIAACVLMAALAIAAVCSWRRIGFQSDWLFAVLVSVHVLVLHFLVVFDWWSPTTSSVKSLLFAAVFAISVLVIGMVIRLFRFRLTLGLVVFYLILLLNISGLYVAINAQWFRG